jgi:hypothetical protein
MDAAASRPTATSRVGAPTAAKSAAVEVTVRDGGGMTVRILIHQGRHNNSALFRSGRLPSGCTERDMP